MVAKHVLIGEEARLAVDLVRFGLVRFSAPVVYPEREESSATPRWERDELVLALELSLEAPLARPNADEPRVVALTELLNALPVHAAHAETIRTPTDVATMLSTLSGLTAASGAQSSRTNSRAQEVCREFAGKHELLKSLAKGIRAAHTLPEVAAPAVAEEDEEEFAEGRVLYRLHRSRERNPQLVDDAKKAALSRHGKLQCAVCGFDFALVYGDLGHGYIEAHHIVALSEIGAEQTTKVSDLALVCANCHRMLHRRRPWLAVSDLKMLLRA